MQIRDLLAHFECDCHTVHMLTQWHLPPPMTSTVKPPLFIHTHPSIPVHSPWLPGYINIPETILIMLTMAGLFLDTPHMLFLPLILELLNIHSDTVFSNCHTF